LSDEPELWRAWSVNTNIWRTLGYRGGLTEGGTVVIEWDADEAYTFPIAPDNVVVHGGMVTTILDSAMGFVCVSVLEPGQGFLTADLNVEFLRPTRIGTVRAEGHVVHRSRRVVFCAAELSDADGKVLASARCTQIVREIS
jgi:uncharacterized protein (TIGR00369 family)